MRQAKRQRALSVHAVSKLRLAHVVAYILRCNCPVDELTSWRTRQKTTCVCHITLLACFSQTCVDKASGQSWPTPLRMCVTHTMQLLTLRVFQNVQLLLRKRLLQGLSKCQRVFQDWPEDLLQRKLCHSRDSVLFSHRLKKKKNLITHDDAPCRVCIVNAIRVKYLYRWIVNIFVLTPPPFCVPPHTAFSCLHCHLCWCNSYVTDGHVCLSRGGNVRERTCPRWKTDLLSWMPSVTLNYFF